MGKILNKLLYIISGKIVVPEDANVQEIGMIRLLTPDQLLMLQIFKHDCTCIIAESEKDARELLELFVNGKIVQRKVFLAVNHTIKAICRGKK